MVKFLMLPLVALAVVALMIMPAVASVEDYCENWIGDSGVMASEILGTNTQAVVWEVHDPPSCHAVSQAVVEQDQPNSDNQLTCRAIRKLGRAVWRLGACLGGC